MKTIAELTEALLAFRDARDWKQFHNLKDCSISLSLEAAELLEIFQWANAQELSSVLQERKEDLKDELADVLYWTLLIAHEAGIDISAAFQAKLEKNAKKYPVDLARGKKEKYSELK